jgi:hypothetical protein
MLHIEHPEIVTFVAAPPAGTAGSTDNLFIDDALQALSSKNAADNRIVRATCIRDIDLELAKILADHANGTVRLQIVGHSLSGVLSLGASWIPEAEMMTKAFRYPYYVLDTNPASLGLLAKYTGKISEVMLVGCNIGSASSLGYAINGRTLTYTLAELLRCLVRGADDIVAPDEFDAHGWYAPGNGHRHPKGWRWVEATPPIWTDPGIDPVPGSHAKVEKSFEIRAITRSMLPGATTSLPIGLSPALRITCQYIAADKPRSALPEISVETDQGPAQLLCGGRYLRWMDTDYVVEHTSQRSATLATLLTKWLRSHKAPRNTPVQASEGRA